MLFHCLCKKSFFPLEMFSVETNRFHIWKVCDEIIGGIVQGDPVPCERCAGNGNPFSLPILNMKTWSFLLLFLLIVK